jgi:predicted permease
MKLFARLRSWCKWMAKSRRLENDMEDEVRFHLESYAADLVRNGVPAPEAMRRARIEFGGIESHKDAIRATLGLRWWNDLGTDLRYGARRLKNSPGFTLTAVLVLAVGIGVNITAFSFFDMLVLKLMPVRDPETLVRIERRSPEIITPVVPYPSVAFYREHARTLSAVMATLGARMELEGDVQPVKADFVTANYFAELGSPAACGRLFDPARDGTANADPVVVLSFGLWKHRFAADPSIIGRVIHLNKKAVTVIGVTSNTVSSLGGQYPEVWLPMTQQPYFVEGSKILSDTSGGNVEMWGRLAPAMTAAMAEQELLALTNELRKQYPKDIWDHEFIHIEPAGHMQIIRPEMYQVMAMVGTLTLLILAVACANLGGLLLAQGVKREHEIGIRIAIGASRQRVFRQLFTESLLLALLGSAVGTALGYVVLRTVLVEFEAPAWVSAAPDWRVFLFATSIALAAALFFGLAPALKLARRRQRKILARQVLVGAQVAASCVLLIVAGLLVRAVHHVMFNDPGFGYQQVISIDPEVRSHGYTPVRAQAFFNQLEDRLRALPGVTSVSLVKVSLMGNSISRMGVDINGHPVDIYPNWVSPEFFQTMDIPMLRGRALLAGEKNAVIVSESLARQQWPGADPIGKLFWEKDTVVGVAGNAHVNSLNDGDTVEVYWAAQADDMQEMTLLVKTAGTPEGFPPMVKSITESFDPNLFPEIRLLKTAYHKNMLNFELAAAVVSLLGLAAVLLAAIGLLGLVAYSVSERAKEIAIRIALGAKPAHVLSAILRQFAWPVVVGLLAGTAGTAALSQILRKVLFGVNNLDPLSYAAAIAVLLAIAATAALLPARRALHVDPMRALHCD